VRADSFSEVRIGLLGAGELVGNRAVLLQIGGQREDRVGQFSGSAPDRC